MGVFSSGAPVRAVLDQCRTARVAGGAVVGMTAASAGLVTLRVTVRPGDENFQASCQRDFSTEQALVAAGRVRAHLAFFGPGQCGARPGRDRPRTTTLMALKVVV
jgi:hypothetical protein